MVVESRYILYITFTVLIIKVECIFLMNHFCVHDVWNNLPVLQTGTGTFEPAQVNHTNGKEKSCLTLKLHTKIVDFL